MPPAGVHPLIPHLEAALAARAELFDEPHQSAFRLFNGFYEGGPNLVIDLYARTIVIFDYSSDLNHSRDALEAVRQHLLDQFGWLQAILLKSRSASLTQDRVGSLLSGDQVDHQIREHGVWYAIDLQMSQDAGFYLDTRNLRAWALTNLANKSVLNTFASTGSLGVAARAGRASRVVQVDLKHRSLELAKKSYRLNNLQVDEADFIRADFFAYTGRLRRTGHMFDCAILDPPLFSATRHGTVDLQNQFHRLVNKVRPLVKHGGYLVAINNAVYTSGADYLKTLEALCQDGFLSIDKLIPVPLDVTGYPLTKINLPPVDPAPFNHSTKIAVLHVRRKDAKT